MNKIVDSEEQWLAELAVREAWIWDGANIEDAKTHFDWFQERDCLLLGGETKYLSTVPAELRERVSFVDHENELNSEDYHRQFMHVLACDVNGQALVKFTTFYVYEDVDSDRLEIMPIDAARSNYMEFKKIHLEQTNEDVGSALVKRNDDSPSP